MIYIRCLCFCISHRKHYASSRRRAFVALDLVRHSLFTVVAVHRVTRCIPGLHRRKNGERYKIVDERVAWSFKGAVKKHIAPRSDHFLPMVTTLCENAAMPLFAASAFTGTALF